MALDRTWVNGLVNDDGSNTTGELWDKADVVHIYDDVDAALLKAGRADAPSSPTTAGDIAALALPPGDGPLLIRMANTTLATIRGIAAGKVGQELTILAVGTGQVDFTYNDAAAAAGNKLLPWVSSGRTSLKSSASNASARFVYDTSNRWVLTAHEQGDWITPPYSAAHYTGGLAVDAGDVVVGKYKLSGRTLMYGFALNTISLSGSPASVSIGNGAWGGFTASGISTMPIGYANDGAVVPAYIQAPFAGATSFTLAKTSGTWGTTTNGGYLQGTMVVEVQ